jgi:protein-tyrosine phosphatase
MICLGNICRSPLAQGILQQKVSGIAVDSAGTAGYHIGARPDSRSIEVAKKYGIEIQDQKARQFSVRDFDQFTHLFVMDQSNYQDVMALARDDNDRQKVQLILSDQKEVPDPYYTDKKGFENCYQLLNKACDRIAKSLENG